MLSSPSDRIYLTGAFLPGLAQGAAVLKILVPVDRFAPGHQEHTNATFGCHLRVALSFPEQQIGLNRLDDPS
jgi:hypothetical protein